MNFLGMGVRETKGTYNVLKEISGATREMSAAISHGPLWIQHSHDSVCISNEDEYGHQISWREKQTPELFVTFNATHWKFRGGTANLFHDHISVVAE